MNNRLLTDEETGNVMVSDLPRQEEYRDVLYLSQEVGKYTNTDFKRSSEANTKAWRAISDLMAGCIARGMRLQSEKNTKTASIVAGEIFSKIEEGVANISGYENAEQMIDDGFEFPEFFIALKSRYVK